MAFDTAPITAIRTFLDDGDLLVTWTSTAPARSYYQVYVDHRLVWHGTSRRCQVPMPVVLATIQVGTVLPAEVKTNFAGSLTSVGGDGNRVTLNWTGGTYLDPSGNDDVVGFRIYRSATAGGAVDYSKPVGNVSAYPAGVILDGWGDGGWGDGGWGCDASQYSWTSGPLSSGTWNFAVKVYNSAGIEGTALTFPQDVTGPPSPPAMDGQGKRLTYTYDAGTGVATLNWNASA